MRIRCMYGSRPTVVVDARIGGQVEVEDLFEGLVVVTPQGRFGICQREGAIEVTHNGALVWPSAPQKPGGIQDETGTMGQDAGAVVGTVDPGDRTGSEEG